MILKHVQNLNLALVFSLLTFSCGDSGSNKDGYKSPGNSGYENNDDDYGSADTPPQPTGGESSDDLSLTDGPGEFILDFQNADGFFTLMQEMVKGSSPHDMGQTWYSVNIKELISQASFEVPEGTVAIKAFDQAPYDGIDGYAVMIKQPAGFDDANQNWEYQMLDANGEVLNQGRLAGCIGCHSAAKAKDYLRATAMR